MRRFLVVTGMVVVLGLASVQVASARNIGNFNVTVGALQGTATTNNLTKVRANIDGVVNASGGVGAGRTVSARVERSSGGLNGSYVSFTSYERRRLPNLIGANVVTRMRLRNQLTATVSVQAQGTWSPDHQ